MFTKRNTASPTIENALSGRYNDHEMAAIDELSTIIELEAGQTFVREGAVGREALIIISGSAAVSRGVEIVATVGAGDIVGESALLTGQPRNATLVATSATKVAVLNPREFSSLLARCPRLEAEVKEIAAQRS